MSDLAIQQVLAQMRQMKTEATNGIANGAIEHGNAMPGAEASGDAAQAPSFADVLQQSIGQVNELQQASSEIHKSFARGVEDVNLTEVMVAGQKSRIAFEAMVQVRNRLLEAYQEIQRMQI